MRVSFLITLLFVGAHSFTSFGDDQAVDLGAVVKRLGSSEDIYKDLELLRSNPTDAVKLIVKELKPTSSLEWILIDEQKNRARDFHIVWCVRALRYITGKNFVAVTNHRFVGEDEEARAHFLGLTMQGEVSFFGTRMSRDTVHLAPKDAQREIIRQWKVWVKRDLPGFEFPKESPELNNWYF